MPYRIMKEFSFEAAHKLEGLREGHPCGNLHGHSYRVQIVLTAEKLDDVGFVVDFGKIEKFRNFYIDFPSGTDHCYLNDRMGLNPTSENLARTFYIHAGEIMSEYGISVEKVRVSETGKTWAEYWEEK